jgi:aldehyde dehydrogenase (NAD+)
MATQNHYDKIFIGGTWVDPATDDRITVISPVTEQPIVTVARAMRHDVDAAVAAARRAFDEGPWRRMLVAERIAVVTRVRDGFAARAPQMSQLITDEMGCPITQSINIQTVVPVRMLDAYCEIARSYKWSELRQSSSGNALVRRNPKGVVAMIVPWNTPMMAVLQKLGPALLAGCTVVIKAATESPLSASLLAEILNAAGVPPGVVNMVTADREESEYLALHPGIDKVSFTGSTVAGRILASKCGVILRPITLELGGKSAGIILDDADIPAAIEALRLGSFRNSGQICTLKTRVLVSKKKRDEVLEALEGLIDSMPVGDPRNPDTQIGPMVSQRQRDRVQGYIETAITDGARVLRGGPGLPEGVNRGWFVRPTLLADVDPNSRIAQEEVFGPVLAVISYEDEDEAIRIANNSTYGLSGAVFSRDVARAVAVADAVHTGVVEVNGAPAGFTAPFGGVKNSGMGRESGWEGFEPYVELKTIAVPKDYADSLH